MKRYLLNAILVAGALALPAYAQAQQSAPPTARLAQPPVDKKGEPAPPALSPEQQQQLAQALSAAQSERLKAEAATARAEKAQADVQATAFRIMAVLRVSPEEFDIQPSKEGGFVVVKKEPKPQP